MAKSGSTFAFQIAKAICARHLSIISGRFYTVHDLYPETPNPDFLSYRYDIDEFAERAYDLVGCQNNRILIAKIHQKCLPRVQEMVNAGYVYSISTFRHPEEIALSLVDSSIREKKRGLNRFKFFKVEETIEEIESNINNYHTWRTLNNNLNIFFDELALDPYQIARKISNHLGLRVETKPIVDFFLEDKEKRILQYNKGIVDRHKIDFPQNMKSIFNKQFSQFILHVNQLKKHITNS
jgi:hypothetical protein